MTALESTLRKSLERAVVRARDIAEDGARATLQTLAVSQPDAFPTMSKEQRDLRTSLRAKAKNLGEGERQQGIAPLVEEIAYEQWHRLLFARFLAENRLLMHPLGGHLSIEECAELAPSEGADNGWDLAGRYAALMLPGIFRAGDPAAQIRLAREYRSQLETLVAGLPDEVFISDDGLGWSYQFWQVKRSEEVKDSGRKIGAEELSPKTQFFTEDYMVRFLLENTLGAWWTARHPESPLVREMIYLRVDKDGAPAAGTFPGWPERAAEITVMDPCCGSGHFLVRALHLLQQMRMEEERLDERAAGDAVLRDNLFGLELDERCVQIASFAVTLEAWKRGGYREIPAPQVACTGIPVGGQLEEWLRLAGGDENLRQSLSDLHRLFREARSLGSLIDPQQVVRRRGLFAPKLAVVHHALQHLGANDVEIAAVASVAGEVARAVELLGRTFTVTLTNPPFLPRGSQDAIIQEFCEKHYSDAKADLATAFIDRCLAFTTIGGAVAMVSPHNWLFLGNYKVFRNRLLTTTAFDFVARLGAGAFDTVSGEVVAVSLIALENALPRGDTRFAGIDAAEERSAKQKAKQLRTLPMNGVGQAAQLKNPDGRIVFGDRTSEVLLQSYATSLQGITTGDNPRFVRTFWELNSGRMGWELLQSAPEETTPYGGRTQVLFWQDGAGELATSPQARVQGLAALGKRGVSIGQMHSLAATLFTGQMFDMNAAVILPKDSAHVPAVWAFCSSPEFKKEVRKIDQKLNVTNATLVKVPFNLERWQKVAQEMGSIPEPYSDGPTQWLFKGHPKYSTAPLQVAVARLLGYRWPEQHETDGLDSHMDPDGIVPLVSVRGETPAAERLRALLADALVEEWSGATQERLLAEVDFAGRDLGAWLADGRGFFAQHARLFHNRPFIWQIWDGARDGFSALVNYHKLTPAALDRLIYTYLGDWISRQEQARAAGEPSPEDRLIKARALKAKLEAIRDGEPPYDVYVRWKPLHEQPIGWDPDLNDGVRLNIRPFVEAGVLRTKFSINWNKDRGDNPPGSTARQYAAEAQQAAINARRVPPPDGRERLNDLHLTRKTKQEARDRAMMHAQAKA